MTLTRQDWRGPRAGWNNDAVGYWETEIEGTGSYDITARFRPQKVSRQARLKIGSLEQTIEVPAECRQGHVAA
ncbi:MAG: hypothetical protein U0903_18655 [Planctomycetales bacterium]